MMKIKEGFLLREVAGSHVVVPVGGTSMDFSGMITLNETGAFLWKLLSEPAQEEEVVRKLIQTYGIDEEKARHDVTCFLEKLKEEGLLV